MNEYIQRCCEAKALKCVIEALQTEYLTPTSLSYLREYILKLKSTNSSSFSSSELKFYATIVTAEKPCNDRMRKRHKNADNFMQI